MQFRHMKLLSFYIINSPVINLTGNPGRWNSLNVDMEVESNFSYTYRCLLIFRVDFMGYTGRFKSTNSCIVLGLRLTAFAASVPATQQEANVIRKYGEGRRETKKSSLSNVKSIHRYTRCIILLLTTVET